MHVRMMSEEAPWVAYRGLRPGTTRAHRLRARQRGAGSEIEHRSFGSGVVLGAAEGQAGAAVRLEGDVPQVRAAAQWPR